MIPKTIYMCDKNFAFMSVSAENWNRLNPEYQIYMYDDDMCENFLSNEFSELYREIFNHIQDGPIKADFWRICILYKYGGVYADVDVVPLVPIDDFVEKYVDLAICSTYVTAFQYSPHFLMAPRHSDILKKCIDTYITYYMNKKKYSYWGWSIVRVMSDVLKMEDYNKKNGIYYTDDGEKIQIIEEVRGKNHYDAHNIYNNVRVLNTRNIDWNGFTHTYEKDYGKKHAEQYEAIYNAGYSVGDSCFSFYYTTLEYIDYEKLIVTFVVVVFLFVLLYML